MTPNARKFLWLLSLFVNIFRTTDAVSRNAACDAFEAEVKAIVEEEGV